MREDPVHVPRTTPEEFRDIGRIRQKGARYDHAAESPCYYLALRGACSTVVAGVCRVRPCQQERPRLGSGGALFQRVSHEARSRVIRPAVAR
jgi:hypothetical protein